MQFICALDIGTSKIRAILVKNENGAPKIIGVLNQNVSGLRHGAIIDLEEVNKSLLKIFSEIKNIEKRVLKNIYVNIGTTESGIETSTAATGIAAGDSEISEEEIEKVKKLSEAINLGPNRIILHSIPQEFIIDGVGGISDPLGLSGNRLEIKSLIINVFSPHLKNLTKVVSLCGGRPKGIIFNPISSARSSLSKNQKELGVILIDFGAGTTSLAIYLENKLLHAKILPVGSANITSDIAVGLKIPYEVAEKIKIEQGVAFPKEVGSRETIDLSSFLGGERNIISKKFLAEIIEARLDEIFELVNKELKVCGKNIELSSGAVLVGGGAKMKGLTNLAKNNLKLSVQIGSPISENFIFDEDNEEFKNVLNDPEYANALGLVLWAIFYEKWMPANSSFIDRIKKMFSYFNP
ncbi:MAG: cell division protein FtsA [Candidatus Parcubacteria bacterium]|nr:MAG: cell division protein FtsA [Candidatus Parcubacteria bacterium]